MTLDLFLIELPQVRNASLSIGCLKKLLNFQWLFSKTCVEIENMLFAT
jgi:hypothetical protein